MKKLILAAIVLLSFTACRMLDIFRTTEPDPTHAANWYIKNLTEKPLRLSMRDWRGEKTLVAGDSLCLFDSQFPQIYGAPTFAPFFTYWNIDNRGEEQYLTISSAEGEKLRTWTYTPESAADEPFFEESSWRLYQEEHDTSSELEMTWVYDLRPEDLDADL